MVVSARAEHEVEWLAPAALWGAGGVNLRAPALVRIDGDDFMAQFARMFAPDQPRGAALWAARSSAADQTKAANVLYQSVHGCYALVCASLTCRAAGRPERAIAPTRESVAFVLRRVEADGTESAWVPAGSGTGSWQPASGSAPLAGEEQIPMFPVPAPGSPARRVWAGLVPTASRETYREAPAAPGTPPDPTQDPRLAELADGPLLALQGPATDTSSGNPVLQRAAYESALQAALALGEFINDYILPQGGIAKGDIPGLLAAPGLGAALTSAGLAGGVAQAWQDQAYLLGTTAPPDGYPTTSGGLVLPVGPGVVGQVLAAITAALPPLSQPVPGAPGLVHPKFDLSSDQKYIVRCLYLRPNCPVPVVASAASDQFAIAPAHDPDAPARTHRIPMPIDVSGAGLRKFKKNVGFVLSPALNARVSALTGKKLKDIDDGNVSPGGIGVGEICSFALPIITLCAMIVLFIFIALLNIVFFWMPLVKICFPIPQGKKS